MNYQPTPRGAVPPFCDFTEAELVTLHNRPTTAQITGIAANAEARRLERLATIGPAGPDVRISSIDLTTPALEAVRSNLRVTADAAHARLYPNPGDCPRLRVGACEACRVRAAVLEAARLETFREALIWVGALVLVVASVGLVGWGVVELVELVEAWS